MSLTLRTDFGCTEAVIDDDCGLKRFYEVANILPDDLDINFNQKTDDFDSLMWDFIFKGHILTLHYNIYTGISIYPRKFREASRKDNDAVVEVARFPKINIDDQYGQTVLSRNMFFLRLNREFYNSSYSGLAKFSPSFEGFFYRRNQAH